MARHARRIRDVRWHAVRVLGALALGAAACGPGGGATRPNVVLVLTDDQGWSGTSVVMDPAVPDSRSDYYETPRLEAFAAQGMTFSQAYAPSPSCSPTRISIQTGKSPQALGMTSIIERQPGGPGWERQYEDQPLRPPVPIPRLPPEELTLGEAIHAADPAYVTGHLGKWHVEIGPGTLGPGGHGYDVHDGPTLNAEGEVGPPDPKRIFSLTGRATRFLTERAADGRPFFLQISHWAVHVTPQARDETRRKYEAKPPGEVHKGPVYAAMTEDLDTSLGLLLDVLDQTGLAEDTFVIVMSDNGGSMNLRRPVTSNFPLRGGKTQVWEGGIRVPLLVRGPGIEPGSRCAVPVIGWDLFPTILELLGLETELPEGVEGGSFAGLLRDGCRGEVRRPGEALVWHYPHYLPGKGTKPQSAIRVGDEKLVHLYESDESFLFDLSEDVGEAHDLSAERPERAAALRRQLDAYLAAVGAPMATRR